MSKGVNKFIGIGNVCADPETRYMANGSAVVNLTLATSDSWKDKNSGENVEKTEFIRIVFFNKLAEIVGKYVKKGSKLYIEGRLQTRSWEQDGIKRYATEIVANEMQLLDSKPATVTHDQTGKPVSAMDRAQKEHWSPPAHKLGVQESGGFDNFNDDIPF